MIENKKETGLKNLCKSGTFSGNLKKIKFFEKSA